MFVQKQNYENLALLILQLRQSIQHPLIFANGEAVTVREETVSADLRERKNSPSRFSRKSFAILIIIWLQDSAGVLCTVFLYCTLMKTERRIVNKKVEGNIEKKELH